jgi:hypothetical protein
MRQATWLGFSRSALRRLSVAGLYAIAAVSLVLLVQGYLGRHDTSVRERPSSPAAERASLTLTATYAVETWTVQCQGRDLPMHTTGSHDWRGEIPVSVGSMRSAEVFVHAEPHDALASGPCALRATLTTASGGSTTQVLWGDGAIAAPITLAVAGTGSPP